MRRREFIALLGSAAIAAPPTARAEMPAKLLRLAVVSPMGLVPAGNPNAKVLLEALMALGYAPGQNLIFEEPAGPPGPALPPDEIARQVKARNIDVVVAWGYPVVVAAKAAGIPTVVAFGVGDPVATGLVQSLAQPGGDVTGISDVATTLSTKRLGLLEHVVFC